MDEMHLENAFNVLKERIRHEEDPDGGMNSMMKEMKRLLKKFEENDGW